MNALTGQKVERHAALHRVSDIDIARILVENGADVNIKDGNGDTPLHRISSLELATFFLENGADIDAKGSGGLTVLEKARKNGNEKLASLLEAEKLRRRAGIGGQSKKTDREAM